MVVLFTVVAADVHLEFLRNEPNLTNSSWVSAFFCCNVMEDGPNLSWEINGRGIGVFGVNHDLEGVIIGTMPDYSYIATTLSLSRMNGSSLYNFDSVLIVRSDSLVQVNCVSDSSHASATNLDTLHRHNVSSDFREVGFVHMVPIVINSATIVSNVYTSIFACASSGLDLLWTTDMNDRIEFNSSSNFGRSDSRSATNRNGLRLQGISLGKGYKNFVSILYLSDNAVTRVGCSATARTSIVEFPDDFETVPGEEWLIYDLLDFHFLLCLDQAGTSVEIGTTSTESSTSANQYHMSTDNLELQSASGSFKIETLPCLMEASLMMVPVLVANLL